MHYKYKFAHYNFGHVYKYPLNNMYTIWVVVFLGSIAPAVTQDKALTTTTIPTTNASTVRVTPSSSDVPAPTSPTPGKGKEQSGGQNTGVIVAVVIIIVLVIVCAVVGYGCLRHRSAIRKKKKPDNTTTKTAGASFCPPTETVILPQSDQPVPVSHGTNITTNTTSTSHVNQCFVRDADEDSQVDKTRGTTQDDDYLVPLAKARQPVPQRNGTGSMNAAAAIDCLEVQSNKNTRIQQAGSPIHQGEENRQSLTDQVLSSRYAPGRDTGAQGTDHEYTYIDTLVPRARLEEPLDQRARLDEPTEIDSPPIYEYADLSSVSVSPAVALTNQNSNRSDKSQPRGSGERVIPAPPTPVQFGSESSRLARDNHDNDKYVNQEMVGKQRSRANVI